MRPLQTLLKINFVILNINKVAPTYEKVAKLIEHNSNIVLTEYDGTKNENEEISISGYPTVLFFPANNKASPITF